MDLMRAERRYPYLGVIAISISVTNFGDRLRNPQIVADGGFRRDRVEEASLQRRPAAVERRQCGSDGNVMPDQVGVHVAHASAAQIERGHGAAGGGLCRAHIGLPQRRDFAVVDDDGLIYFGDNFGDRVRNP